VNILDLNKDIVRKVVEELMIDENYTLDAGCANLFVFKKTVKHESNQLLPIQKRYKYDEKINLEFFESVSVVDYTMPTEMKRGESYQGRIVYVKRTEKSLGSQVLFLSLINERTGDIYQLANLPSYAITRPEEWKEGYYYIEDLNLTIPGFLETGKYKILIGMGNKIRTRSMYLGDVEVK
jgi:hypothetical protein